MGKTAKDKRDIYYRKAKEEGWRARSAFKLLQLNEEFNIFKDVKKAVDLCAAPGSWSQVLSRELCEKNPNKDDVQIIAIDLQPMSPIPFVEQLQGDITEENTAKDVIKKFNNKKADLVICDGAPDVTGLHSMDEYMQSQLILAAFNITTFILKEGGNFIAKIFRARNCTLLYHQMKFFFKEVKCAKPKASRQSSCEAFIVCLGYNPPMGYLPTMKNSILAMKYDDVVNTLNGPNRTLVPFVACGDLSGFDSDRSYPLDISKCFPEGKAPENVQEYKRLEVVQPPTEPAYKKALEHKKNDTLKKKMFLQSKAQKDFTKKKNPEETACNLGYEDEIVEAMSNIFAESNS